MKDRTKKIIVVALVIIAVASIGVIINWANAEEEIDLYIVSNTGRDVFTIVEEQDEIQLLIYYNKCDGNTDNEFMVYMDEKHAPDDIFSIYANGVLLSGSTYNTIMLSSYFGVTDGTHIRLQSIYDVEVLVLAVNFCGEKDCFFDESVFYLTWKCEERDYEYIDGYAIRYYNIDKVTSLNWPVPDGFNLTFNNDWVEDNYVGATMNHSGWYMLKGRIINDIEPWRSTDVDLWFNPGQNETHMVPHRSLEVE